MPRSPNLDLTSSATKARREKVKAFSTVRPQQIQRPTLKPYALFHDGPLSNTTAWPKTTAQQADPRAAAADVYDFVVTIEPRVFNV